MANANNTLLGMNSSISMVEGSSIEVLLSRLRQQDWEAVYTDVLPSLSESAMHAALELITTRLAHTGLLIGTGYDASLANGTVYHTVNAFCTRHGFRLEGVSADASATFVVRIEHRTPMIPHTC